MELRQLKTFSTLASTLNFSRTAELLNYVPSTVTMQIKALEEELGVKLLDRLGKKVSLTDAGSRFLPYVNKILNDMEEAQHALIQSGEVTGTVVIGADEVLCAYRLPALLRSFRENYPGVRLLFRPLSSQHLVHSLKEGSTDVVFALGEPAPAAGVRGEMLMEEPFHMVVSPDHPLASRPVITIDDFFGEQFLLSEKGCSYRTFFNRTLVQKGLDNVAEMEFNSAEAIKQCAIMGIGIAFLPEVIIKAEVERGELVILPWDLAEVRFGTQMLWHQEKWLSPAIEAFLNFARNVVKEVPA